MEVHPWNVIRALKTRLAPSDAARILKLEQQYKRLRKGPSSRQNVESWLDDYLKMYTLGKESKVAELTDGKRAYRDFLYAIENTAPTFADIHELRIDTVPDYDSQLLLTIENFRHYIRLKKVREATTSTSNSAFAANKSNNKSSSRTPSSSRTSSFRGGNRTPPTCICGSKHWYSECFYLNEDKCPANWKPNKEVQKKVNEGLKNDQKREGVERNIARSKEFAKAKND